MASRIRGSDLAVQTDIVELAPQQVITVEHTSLARAALRRFLRHRLAVLGVVMLTIIVLGALLAPFLTNNKPFFTDLQAVGKPPGPEHILGTDRSGRDVWARLLFGAQTFLIVGLGAVTVYVTIGIVLGGLAGFLGGSVDQVIMRATDTLMSIPTLLLVIVFVSAIGPSLFSVLIVIGLLGWPGAARLVRGQLLALRESEFITAARVVGVPNSRIMTRHLLPNILSSLAVLATFGVASAIILEASLSFLGLGVKIPTPSWGGMINEAQSPTVLLDMPWLWLAPGIAIALTVLSVNFIGDGLRDALDPKSMRRA